MTDHSRVADLYYRKGLRILQIADLLQVPALEVSDSLEFNGTERSTFVSVGAQVARGDRNEGDIRREVGDGLATEVNRVSRSIVERYLDVQPTITVRPGWPVRVSVNRDIRLAPYGQLGG